MIIESEKLVKNPIITVCVLCYNQNAYISKCIESILSQETEYSFELLIGDDCSTDGGLETCKHYQESHPDKIKLIANNPNQGLISNYINLLSNARGKYIAVCGGDDYWCDTHKLQKQTDFLQANPDFSMCFTNAYEESNFSWEGYRKTVFAEIPQNQEFKGEDIILKWVIPASSVMFCNGLVDFSFLTKRKYYAEDLATYLKLAEYGKIYGMADISTVYVRHKESITNAQLKQDKAIRNYTTTLQSIDEELNGKYHSIIRKDLSMTYYKSAKGEYKRGNKSKAMQRMWQSMMYSPSTSCHLLIDSLIR